MINRINIVMATLLVVFFFNKSFGQAWTTPSGTDILLTDGNTGMVMTDFCSTCSTYYYKPLCLACDPTDPFHLTFGRGATEFPLIINGNISFMPSNSATGYHERKIIGYTRTGNLALYNAGDFLVGSGVKINGCDNTSSAGSVYFGHNTATCTGYSPTDVAFNWGHVDVSNNWISNMIMTKNGHLGIADPAPVDFLTVNGDLSFTENTPTSLVRNINGRTKDESLNIYSETNASGNSINMFGTDNATKPGEIHINTTGNSISMSSNTSASTPDKITFNSKGSSATAFGFYNTTSASELVSMKSNGRVGISDNAPSDLLTINGNFSFTNSSSIDRYILGRATNNKLSIFAENSTTGNSINLYGTGNTTNPGEIHITTTGNSINMSSNSSSTTPGKITFTSSGASTESFGFRNSSSTTELVTVNANGKVGISDNSPSDLLTINGNLSFTSTSTYDRSILGRTPYNKLSLYAEDNTNGNSINLYGSSHYSKPGNIDLLTDGSTISLFSNSGTSRGSIQFNTSGASVRGFQFYNTGISKPIMTINSNGRVRIGNFVPVTSVNDKLTVDGDIAIYNDDPSNDYFRNIKAYSTTGGLNIFSNTGSTDGSLIRLFAKNSSESSTKAGSLEFISYKSSSSANAMDFFYWDPSGGSWSSLMTLTYNHRLTVWGDVYSNTTLLTSDARFKKDLHSIEGIQDKLAKIKPYEYHYKSDEFKERHFDDKKHYGFTAQNVQEVFPELTGVSDSLGHLAVNYVEFIPMLLQAVQEQRQEIKSLKAQINNTKELEEKISTLENKLNNIQTDLSACCNSKTSSADNVDARKSSLEQNIPNPFNGETIINYSIAQGFQKAFIGIYDLSGKEVKVIPIKPGSNSITLHSDQLSTGMYIYSLIVDNNLIDSKRMVINK